MIVKNGLQIEGDSIRCPYHGWRYNAQGDVDDIPYFDGPCPKSASIRSYPVVDNMGCVMAWFDPDGRAPDYDPPFLPQWDDPQWVNWKLDHLGELKIHPQYSRPLNQLVRFVCDLINLFQEMTFKGAK